MYRQSEKNLLNSNTSSTCPDNMVNFGLLTAEICWRVWGTPANFNGFCALARLLHGTLVVGVSHTLQHWTEGATYIRQGGHHVGHWPTFLVNVDVTLFSFSEQQALWWILLLSKVICWSEVSGKIKPCSISQCWAVLFPVQCRAWYMSLSYRCCWHQHEHVLVTIFGVCIILYHFGCVFCVLPVRNVCPSLLSAKMFLVCTSAVWNNLHDIADRSRTWRLLILTNLWYGGSAGNTCVENSSVFSLI